MDFSSFMPWYAGATFKEIGQYRIYIFKGESPITKSIPEDDDLDWNQYTVLGACIENKNSKLIDLLDLGLSLNGYHVTDRYYNLPILELENVYNKLCELAGEPVKLNKIKEKPCYRCGEMNDIGAFACWSFTCGVSNPTGV